MLKKKTLSSAYINKRPQKTNQTVQLV